MCKLVTLSSITLYRLQHIGLWLWVQTDVYTAETARVTPAVTRRHANCKGRLLHSVRAFIGQSNNVENVVKQASENKF
jgi:hypothetical protein